ncbi:MAG: ABC transporter permease [Elusimicrobiota bacterium]|nr:ABC transporter permease [Elusimicrobiota bacterium]
MLKIYFQRLKNNKLAICTICVIFILLCIAISAPIISPKNPIEQNLVNRLIPPSSKYIFGTDELGRDVFSRIIYGSRISLSVSLIAVSIMSAIGVSLGLLSGYFGKRIDSIIMRLVDIMLCFPTFFLILMVIAFLEPDIKNVMIVIGLTSWPGLTRLIRGEVLSIKERTYIQAAKISGISTYRILFVHILPNVIGPILVSIALNIGRAILVESALSFLGLGVQPPTPSWGNILTSGKDYIHIAWWLSVFPGLAIFITVLSFNLLGESIRDIIDPRTLQ